jgi:NADP-reducing hydrogenase subunit HndA
LDKIKNFLKTLYKNVDFGIINLQLYCIQKDNKLKRKYKHKIQMYKEESMEENKCTNCVEKKLKTEIGEILKKYKGHKDNLIPILNEVQVKYGYIPKIAQIEIANYLNMALAEVYGVITFYSRFTLVPKGKYNVSVCLGTACFVKGSKEILERAKSKLGVEEGQTTSDGKFSLDTTRCVGACGLAPVFTVNDEVYGKATVKKMDEVLDMYMSKE